MYRPYVVPSQPRFSLGHKMYSNQSLYDGYYGPPGIKGPHCGNNVDEREIAMIRMVGLVCMVVIFKTRVIILIDIDSDVLD